MLIQSCPLIVFGETTPELSSQSQNKIQPQNSSGLGLQPQNVLVFGGLQHAPAIGISYSGKY
mgnify:CR=1 FL=1